MTTKHNDINIVPQMIMAKTGFKVQRIRMK